MTDEQSGTFESYDLSPDEVKLIIDCLQQSELRSRSGFARWMSDNLGNASDERIQEKMKNYQAFFNKVMALRGKFGDNTKIKTSH